MVKNTLEERQQENPQPFNVNEMIVGYTVDLTKKDDIFKVAGVVKEEVGTVDILINNAGIVTGKHFLETTDEENVKTMQTNIISHFWVINAQ